MSNESLPNKPASPASRMLLQALVESEQRKESRAALAERMGVEVEILDAMIQAFDDANGEGAWGRLIAESRVRNDVTTANWDELELETTQRLATAVKQGKVTRVSDLLAIARTANSAARRGFHERANQSGSSPGGMLRAGISLPDGRRGMIELSLQPTIANSIRGEDTVINAAPEQKPFGSGRFEMLESPEELRKLAGEADRSDESDS